MPPDWIRTEELLKSRPGEEQPEVYPAEEEGTVFPVLHCNQEIPCNPCTAVCPQGNIYIDPDDIRQIPRYIAEQTGKLCIGCEKCVTICPGLAITLVDMRQDGDPIVTIPFEFGRQALEAGDWVTVLDTTGMALGKVEVLSARIGRTSDRTMLVKVKAPRPIARQIAGIQVQKAELAALQEQYTRRLHDDQVVCRCERVLLQEIKEVIKAGSRDMNEIKALTRAGLGACGGKTCRPLIQRVFHELGVPQEDVTAPVERPLFVEVPFSVLAGAADE